MPFTGITTTTIEIALVAYTLVILFPTIVAGLRSAPPEVLEAARGMGLTSRQTLTRVELPLAVPTIISGLRIAVVSTISIATIAAFLMPPRARPPDPLRARRAAPVQDRDLRRRRSRGRAGARLRRGAGRAPPGACTLVAEDDVILLDQFRPGTFVDAIRFIGDNPGFLLTKAAEQLELSAAALGLALLIALPAGVILGHVHRGSGFAIGTSIVGRALPSLVLIGVFLTVLGIGFVNNMVALAVLATGPILTNAYVAVDGVDRDVVEAARGMGMSGSQILRQVELPLAAPLIFTGVRIAAVTVVATSTIAAVAGGGGLGDVIVNQASYRLAGVLGASLCVMALSAGVWGVLLALQKGTTVRRLAAQRVGQTDNHGKETL